MTGRKKSKFPSNQTIPSGSTLDFVSAGVNYKISLEDFLAALSVTGTISQQGSSTATPVLDVQGSVNNIRNLENGPGVKAYLSPENGVTLSHNITVDVVGQPIMQGKTLLSPVLVSIIAGDGIDVSTIGASIQIKTTASSSIADGIIVMPTNSTDTVINTINTPVIINGVWTIGVSKNMTGTGSGRLTYTGLSDSNLSINALLRVEPASGSKTISAYVAVNGMASSQSKQTVTASAGSPENISLVWLNQLSHNDYIEVFIENNTDTTDLLVSRSVIRVN